MRTIAKGYLPVPALLVPSLLVLKTVTASLALAAATVMPGRPSEGGSSGTDIDCFVEVNVKVKRIHGVDLTCSLVENVSGIGSMRQLVSKSNVALLPFGRPRIGCGCVLAVHIVD